MPQDTPSRDLDKVIVRLPDGVREMLKLQADANSRSMNAEIVARLLESLQPWKPGDEPVVYKVKRQEFAPTTFDLEDVLNRLDQIAQKIKAGQAHDK